VRVPIDSVAPASIAGQSSEVHPDMRIPTWRLVLTGVAIVILVAMGVGLVAASNRPASAPPAAAPVAAAPSASGTPDGSAAHPRLRERLQRLIGRVGPLARHFVDGTLNFTDKDGNLVTVQLDHGTIAAISSGTITITESGGKQVTVSTDASTTVRLGGGAGVGTVADLKAGDEIFVESRLDSGAALAKHILRVPADGTTGPAGPTSSGG
jgi:hypothetical protein